MVISNAIILETLHNLHKPMDKTNDSKCIQFPGKRINDELTQGLFVGVSAYIFVLM